jgi:hypothetical protein
LVGRRGRTTVSKASPRTTRMRTTPRIDIRISTSPRDKFFSPFPKRGSKEQSDLRNLFAAIWNYFLGWLRMYMNRTQYFSGKNTVIPHQSMRLTAALISPCTAFQGGYSHA